MVDRKRAVLEAIRLFQSVYPDAPVRAVEARLLLQKYWLVNFEKLLPDGVVECPGSWSVRVDAETGRSEWFAQDI